MAYNGDMSHDHHSHTSNSFGRAFAAAVVLNIGIVLVQAFYGFYAHSTALLADATHNAGDVLSLIMAWSAYVIAKKRPSQRFTYGMRSGTVLAALFNSLLLLVVTGAIVFEAVRRFYEPATVESSIVMAVAAAGIVLNGFSAWLLSGGDKDDINTRSAFWHLVSDAAVSAGVVFSAFLIALTGSPWIDPATSIVIALIILQSTWKLAWEALRLSLHAVPADINAEEVRRHIAGFKGVVAVHDLHIWPMSTSETALSCHLTTTDDFDPELVSKITHNMEHHFGIGHCTIQLEAIGGKPCKQAPEQVV